VDLTGPDLTQEQADIAGSDERCFDEPQPGALSMGGWQVMVDDGSAVALLTRTTDPLVRRALSDGRAVVFDPRLLWPGGRARLSVIDTPPDAEGAEDDVRRTVVVPAVLSRQTPGLDGVVLPASLAKREAIQTAHLGVVASTTRVPTGQEEERAYAAIEDIGRLDVHIERGYVSRSTLTLLALVVAAVAVTLVGTLTAVGLAAAESRPDLATLAAVGASPGVRRRLAAWQAAVIAGLGTTLGTASGVLVGWALVRLRQPATLNRAGEILAGGDPRWQVVIPWPTLAVVAIGVPLLVAVVGFLATRSRLPMIRRLGQ
jgi:putative ABC transport system permease protein